MNFRCPHCQLEMSAENVHAGHVVSGPSCNGRFQIPALPPAPAARNTVAGKKIDGNNAYAEPLEFEVDRLEEPPPAQAPPEDKPVPKQKRVLD